MYEIQHKILPSIFLVQSLETSSTHSFFSSSLTPSSSFPVPVSLPFFLPSYYHSPLPSINSPNQFTPPSSSLSPSLSLPSSHPFFLPVLTSSLWRQLSEDTLSLLCNDSVCAPPFHSLGVEGGGGEGGRKGGKRGGLHTHGQGHNIN